MTVDSVQNSGNGTIPENIQRKLQEQQNEIAKNNVKRLHESMKNLKMRKENRRVDVYIPSSGKTDSGATYKP